MCSAQSSQNRLHMSGFFLKLADACLCEEPPESCCINRTSSSTSSKVHHFSYSCRKRPSTRNTSRVDAARRHKEQPPTSLLGDRRAAAPSGSLHRYWGLMTSLMEECYNGTRLVFWENTEIDCRSWCWKSHQELMGMSHPGFVLWQLESSFTTIVPIASEQRCYLWNMKNMELFAVCYHFYTVKEASPVNRFPSAATLWVFK